MGVRFSVLILGSVAAYTYLLFNLYDIQLNNGGKYSAQAESQNDAAVLSQARRGAIYFTDRTNSRMPAAINKDFVRIFATPKDIQSPKETAKLVAPIINKTVTELEKIFSKKGTYVLLKKKASEEEKKGITDLKVKGVYAKSVPERFYPYGPLAASVIGFVGPNESNNGSSGRYGLEKQYNSTLSGKGSEKDGVAGKDMVLTIDPNIQKESERILKSIVDKYGAKSGIVIVQEPKTGKILSMGDYPSFDPNEYSEAKVSAYINPAVQEIYEPGSVFKVLTMAAGIDVKKITPDTTFEDTGKLVLNDKTIRNWDLKAYGKVTMTNVIENSLNTGAAFAQRQTGDENFRRYIERFGFGERTGIDLPGEVKGNLSSITPKSAPINFAAASFGQGVAVTPIQMINAFSAIANGGELMKPYVNSDVRPQVIRRVISEDTAKKVALMMVSAVDKAEVAKISGYTIAGKTGTAQVPGKGGYTDKVNNTYIGFGPTNDPRFVIFFEISEPEGAPLAGQTVVPAFRELAQFILNYYNVTPDRL